MKSRAIIAATILTLSLPPLAATAAPVAEPPDPCIVSMLGTTSHLQGAAGSREGAIVLTNRGAKACRLRGRAGIELKDAAGRSLNVQIHADAAQPDATTGAGAQQRHAGIILPAGRAFIAIRWTNWCGGEVQLPVRAIVHLPGRSPMLTVALESLSRPRVTPIDSPPCLGPSLPSTLAVRPIQVVAKSAPLP